MADPSLVELTNAKGPMTTATELSYVNMLDARQTAVAQQAEALGAVELARLNYLVNAIAVRVPTSRVAELRAIPGVAGVYPVVNRRLQLEHSAERIGARYAQETLGFDGTGVTIGIIDTGVDYTHAAFGGPGTTAAYITATMGMNAAVITDTINGWAWPTDSLKVVGGYDFVGPYWDGETVEETFPDPDPIDDGPGAGHGTNVASIAAGWEVVSGTETLVHAGIAPGATIYAYKVCSSVSNYCEGIAMVQAIEQAVIDGVDVINLSIGSDYAAFADDMHDVALNAAADAGVLVSVSAGNDDDLPYILGTPSSADGALSVAASYAVGQNNPGLHVDAPGSITDTTYLAFDFGWAPDPVVDLTAPMT
jgi:subtilisin family serine protease